MSAAGTPPPDEALDELSVLFPDRPVTVADPDTGEPVALTVKAFRFGEAVAMTPLARPLTDALGGLAGPAGEGIDLAAVSGVLADHTEIWMTLLGRACGRSPAWIARLSDPDGSAVEIAMWQANRDFFARRVVAAAATRFRSPSSSTPLCGPDTGEATPTSPGA